MFNAALAGSVHDTGHVLDLEDLIYLQTMLLFAVPFLMIHMTRIGSSSWPWAV